MFVKTYRYRVLADQMDKYLAVQQRASEWYGAHGDHDAIYLQSKRDPYQWMEIHLYANEAAFAASAERPAADAEIQTLWTEFRATLDPAFTSEIEDFQQWRGFAGNGPPDAGQSS